MMIQLTKNLVISADSCQYMLGRATQRQAEDGTIRISMNSPKYYTNISACLKSAVAQAMRDKVADGTISTLQDFINEQKSVQREFAKLMEPLAEGAN